MSLVVIMVVARAKMGHLSRSEAGVSSPIILSDMSPVVFALPSCSVAEKYESCGGDAALSNVSVPCMFKGRLSFI